MRKPIKCIFVLLPAISFLAIAASCVQVARLAGWRKTDAVIPAAKVSKSVIERKIHTIGELRPANTAMIVAPPVGGGTLQIVQLVETGTVVKKGDVVVSFDPSEQEYNLEQAKSQVEEAEQQIKKMKADQAVRAAQERDSLLRARYEVRRNELKVKGNDVLSGIEARKNVIALEESKRKLQQLQRDIESHASSDAADLMMQNVALSKAAASMKAAQQFIETMTCKSPINGVVVLGQNLESLASASGSISISSEMEIPRYRQGDQAYPGRLIAQIQAVDSIEIAAKVIENDRTNMSPGQAVEVRMDSNPLKTYKGTLKSISESANSSDNDGTYVDYLEALSTRSFSSVFGVDVNGDLQKMGVTAQIIIPGKNSTAALSIPRQAVFQKEGKSVAYVRNSSGWQPKEIRINYLTESKAVIDGLAEGVEVALVDPERQKTNDSKKTSSTTSLLGVGNP